MSNSDLPQRIHVVFGADWRDAVRSLLKPRAHLRPWRHGAGPVATGEPVAMILNTEPRCILTTLGFAVGGLDRVDVEPHHLTVVPVAALRGPDYGFDDDIETWLLEGELAASLAAELAENLPGSRSARWGHHTMAAAAILLHAGSRCAGCHRTDGRMVLEARTVDLEGRDFPVALCGRCRRDMRDSAFGSFIDFKIAQNPDCPECGAHQTLARAYGMPVFDEMEPWVDYAGCCVTPEDWSCLECSHSW